MTHLSIPIPDDLRAKLEARAAESGHASVESYVSELVREDAQAIEYGAPDRVRVRSAEELASLVLEGLNSPAREMVAADWDRLRKDLVAQHRKSKAG